MQNKINKIAIAQKPLKISQNPWKFRPIDTLLCDLPIFWVYLKKKVFLFNF